jgi:hypothetical protein
MVKKVRKGWVWSHHKIRNSRFVFLQTVERDQGMMKINAQTINPIDRAGTQGIGPRD